MVTMYRHLVFCCLAGLVLAAPAGAMIVLDQPLDPTQSGIYSDFPDTRRAESFVLTERTTLETISWAGYYGAPQAISNPVTFNIRFYNDDGGTPGLPLDPYFQEYVAAVDAVPTGDIFTTTDGDTPFLSYEFSLSLTLDPGKYWVGIGEADARTPPGASSQWLWARSTSTGGFAYGNPWQTFEGRGLALTLTGTPTSAIPEPLTVVLLGVALAGLGVARHRRRGN
jgi:hypothetical protein